MRRFTRVGLSLWLFGLGGALGLPLACSGETVKIEYRDPPPVSAGGQGGASPVVDQIGGIECGDEICGASQPLCDGLKGCVECRSDRDCSEQQSCHESTCLTIPSCETKKDCELPTFPVCSEGYCEKCSNDSQCESDERCWTTGECLKISPCETSSDCDSPFVCDRARSYCVACVADIDCEEGATCSSSHCVPTCADDSDCSGTEPYCELEARHCVSCRSDEHCPSDYFCEAGVCHVDNCTSQEKECNEDGSGVAQCVGNGSQFVELECLNGSSCRASGDDAACVTWYCNPGETACDHEANLLRTCSADGLRFDAQVDCRESGGRCEFGACADAVCEPGKSFCQNGDSYLCDALGTGFSLSDDCSVGEYCDQTTGACTNRICTAGTRECVGSVVRACNAHGTGYLSEEVDCSDSDMLCNLGTCREVICGFGSRCNGESVETCTSQGTEVISTPCGSAFHCVEEASDATCVYDACAQDSNTCIGNVARTCNGNGSGFLPDVDCSTANLTCVFQQGCLAEWGGVTKTDSSDDYVFLNHYVAEEDVILDHFDAYLNSGYPVLARWLVYEGSAAAGPFYLLANKTISGLSSYTSWLTSPTMSTSLSKDKHYLIGVHLVSNDSVYAAPAAEESKGSLRFIGSHSFSDPLPLETPRAIAGTAVLDAYHQRLKFQ